MVRRELERRLLKGHGLHMSSYGVLLRLEWAGNDGVRMSELAEQAMLTSGGLTRLVDRLERDGLIVRSRAVDDRRGYTARITPDGRDVLRRADEQHLADVWELVLDHVARDELDVLAAVWQRLKAVNAPRADGVNDM